MVFKPLRNSKVTDYVTVIVVFLSTYLRSSHFMSFQEQTAHWLPMDFWGYTFAFVKLLTHCNFMCIAV